MHGLQLPTEAQMPALDQPSTASSRLRATVVAGCVIILAVAAAAFAQSAHKWRVLPGFNWAYAAVYLICGGVTAVLLLQASLGNRSWSIAFLAAGYMYSALAAVPFLLTFPGTFTVNPEPLVGGSQSSVWTYYLWRLGFLAFVMASTLATRRIERGRTAPDAGADATREITRGTVLLLGSVPAAVMATVVLALGDSLPDLLGVGLGSHKTTTYHILSWSVVAFGLITCALVAAEARKGSELRLWLVPVVLLATFEAVQLPSGGRYRVGWYAPRILGMIATTILLVALLMQVWRQTKALALSRAQSARLASVVEQSTTGLAVLNPAGLVIEVNQALCDLTGFRRDELIDAPNDVPFGSSDDSLADIASVMAGDTLSLTLRRRITRQDGSSLWVDLSAQRLTDDAGQFTGVAVSASDASGGAAADLDRGAPVGMAVITAAGVITRATEALCAIVRRDRSGLIGVPFDRLIADDDRALDLAAIEQLRRGDVEVNGNDLRLLRDDSTSFFATVYRSALRDARGTLVGIALQVIDIDDRKRAEAAALDAQRFLEHRSTYDELTGLFNRPTFVDRVQETLKAGATLAVMVVDVDRFRRVSNSLPRTQADDILVELAQRLPTLLGSDDGDGVILGRVSGDEFAVAIGVPANTASVSALERATQLRDTLGAQPFGPPSHEIYLSCCVGVTVARPGDSAADAMQEADMATRNAKEVGLAQCRSYDERMRYELLARLDLVEQLRAALLSNQFTAWYQPVVSLDDGRLLGYEALSRWIRPDGSVVAPDNYLPAAEDSGLIVPIGACTLEAALERLSTLPAPLTMAVNASPTELLTGDFVGRVRSALQRYAVAPERVIVEITEQSLFDVGRADDAGLTRLVDLGVALHMDDFGTGYSSIVQLRDFPIRGIKLDRSFTADLDGTSTRAAEIASTLAAMATRLGLESVAEGVETRAQAERLAAMGWREGQGWLFGRPQPATL